MPTFSPELKDVLLHAYNDVAYFNELIAEGLSASGLDQLSADDRSQLQELLESHEVTLSGLDALRLDIAPAVTWIGTL